MALDMKSVLHQIDAAIALRVQARARSKHDDLSDLGEGLAEVVTVLADIVNRFAPIGSAYRTNAEALVKVNGMEQLHVHRRRCMGSSKH